MHMMAMRVRPSGTLRNVVQCYLDTNNWLGVFTAFDLAATPVKISRSIFTHWGSEWGHRPSQTLDSSDQTSAPLH